MDVGEEVGGVAQVGERELEEDVLLGVGPGAALVLGARADLGDLLVVVGAAPIAFSKMLGFEVSPVTERSSM